MSDDVYFKNVVEVCSPCGGVGSDDADFDYDRGRFVPYGVCEDCEGSGFVEKKVEES